MNEFSVTPLGTVSPYPKGKCNCPGFLVKSGEDKILLDCGSGVSRLMNFPKDLKNLKILLSHLHLDHYSDLGSFAYATLCHHNLGYLDEKVRVYYPDNYDYGREMNKFLENSYLDIKSYSDRYYLNHVDMELSFLKNVHDVLTYSVKVISDNVSIVYTADTAYNDRLVEFCNGVDLLISEATFLKGQNCTDGHMYAYQAGMLAKEAKVKKLMLTHFWPEIDKNLYVEEAKEYFENTLAAEEGKKLVLREGNF